MDSAPANISPDHLARVVDLYDRGQFLRSYELAKQWGPLSSWQGIEATVFASRLAYQLGGVTLSRWLIRHIFQKNPEHDLVRYFYALNLFRYRGPYPTWRWMHESGGLSEKANDVLKADWSTLLGQLAAHLHDYDTADMWMEKARRLVPSHPWTEVCRADFLECEDRYEEALAAAQKALELRPWYCPALQAAAHLLTLLSRDEEAVRLLTEANKHVESAIIAAQLYAIYIELRQYNKALEQLNRYEQLAPLVEKPHRRWMNAQRSDIAYHLGDLQSAIDFAKQAGRGFHELLLPRLEDKTYSEASSCLLPVGFVRQHRITCAPATLSAICRFWSQPADHLQIAQEICYDGTSAYNERSWAEKNGWLVREFSVSESSASELLDRGIPFTLTTTEPTNAHLQAVIGCDSRRGTFWIRDPFLRNTLEAIANKILTQYQIFGPRGMAMVPIAEAARLDDLELPDATLWDLLHDFDGALKDHHREEAIGIYEKMRNAANGHRLSHHARLRLAIYDANPVERLAALDDLLKEAPENANLQLHRLVCLRDLSRRDERISSYQQLCKKRDIDSVFLQQYAQELRADARRRAEAKELLYRAIRRSPQEAGNYRVLADVLWDDRQFEKAYDLYRFATCLNDKDEDFAYSYYCAARWLKKTEEAIVFLCRRFQRLGRLSSLPARTLVNAYMQCDRTVEALDSLEEAMRLRPDDGELVLFAADIQLACSRENMPKALSLLEKAKKTAPKAQWLRTAASLAQKEGSPEKALVLWRQLLEIQPLAIDAHQAVAQLLMRIHSKKDALSHWATTANRFPHYLPLYNSWLEWVREETPEIRESVIRHALATNPYDAWFHRELAFFLIEQRRLTEAKKEIDIAGELEPDIPPYLFLRAQLLREDGRIEEAKTALREAIRLSVDYRCAVDEAVTLCVSATERRDLLTFVKNELVRQVTFGDGLLAFRNQAHGTLNSEELLAVLREALAERPDLWHSWAACVQQYVAMGRCEEAWELVQQANSRFPLLPALWLERAAVCRARQDSQLEFMALETAYQINPDWGCGVRSLASFHLRRGAFEEAYKILDKAITRQPLDVFNHVMLAECLWSMQQREAAFTKICSALEISPKAAEGWDFLKAWATELGRWETVVRLSRKTCEIRGSEAHSWLLLADSLIAPEQLNERLESLDKAVAIAPAFVQAHDQRAVALAEAQRWEEAKLACSPSLWNGNPPIELKGREIWLQAVQGETQGAIEKMRSLLEFDPNYHTGWIWLWEWYRAIEDYDGCIRASEGMVRINPHHEVYLGYLGESHRLKGNWNQAEDAFCRAFDLNPSYQYAGMALFDIYLADGQLEPIEKILTVLQQHDNNAYVQARAVQHAVCKWDYNRKTAWLPMVRSVFRILGIANAKQHHLKQQAINHFRQLCVGNCDSPWPVTVSVDAMFSAGWGRTAMQILQQSLNKDGVSRGVGQQWIRLRVAYGSWRWGKLLDSLDTQSSIYEETTNAFIGHLVETNKRWQFRSFVRNNQKGLNNNTQTWGCVGAALCHFGWYARLMCWMADWRKRKDAEAWMLLNLAEALRAKGHGNEAEQVNRHALTLLPDYTHSAHRVWLAADAIRSGEIEGAKEFLKDIREDSLPDSMAFVATLTSALVDFASAPEHMKSKVFAEVRLRLSRAAGSYKQYSKDTARRRLYQDCLRLLTKQHHENLKTKIWFWINSFTS